MRVHPITPETINQAARDLLRRATKAEPGDWIEIVLGTPRSSVFAVDFAGGGVVLVNARSLRSDAGRLLFNELRRLGVDRARIGSFSDGPGGAVA